MEKKKGYKIPSFIWGLICGAISFITFFLLGYYFPGNEQMVDHTLKVSGGLGLVFFLIGWLFISNMRSNWRIWDELTELEKNVSGNEDAESLRFLWNHKLMPLSKKCMGAQSAKLKEISIIIKTKLKYLEPDDKPE